MDKKGEELREMMHEAIDKYGHASIEALIASQNLDAYMNRYFKYKK
ncbi:Spo0E family sporulation regulatory protein-aspartic acid phosphatase [Clostridium saccharoperbutylacetonicum]